MTPPERRSARALQITLGFAISAFLVWFSFRKVAFSSLWASVRTVDIPLLLLAIALATIPFPLRVPRWQRLLRTDDKSTPPARPLWQAIAIGFAANNVLPLRAGELLRVGAVSRLARISFATALSSVAVERVIDALTMIAFLGIGLMTAHLPPDVRIGTGAPIGALAARTGVVCLVALTLAVLAAWQRPTALRIFERLLPSRPFAARLVTFADHVLQGLGAMRDLRHALPVVGWSCLIWLVNASAFYVAFRAFHFAVPFSGALVIQGALMIGIAVPSSPGFVGVFEAIIPNALLLYHVDPTAALACAVVYHITTFIPITLMGALAAVRTGVHLKVPPPDAP